MKDIIVSRYLLIKIFKANDFIKRDFCLRFLII